MSPRKPKTNQKRLPKRRRAKQPPRFQITDRDVEFVRAILKYRFLQLSQMEWLFPEASRRGMENRLRYLYHNKYLGRFVLSDSVYSHKLIYAMTEKGARLLAESDGVAREDIPWHRHLNKISQSHIQHLLGVNNVLISFETALSKAKEKGEVETYRVVNGDPVNHRIRVTLRDIDGARYEAAVVPDGVIGIKFSGGEFGLFFVEVDRATMTTKRWQDKVIMYREYARSPELRKRFKTSWFIVLTSTTSERRIMSIAEKTVAVAGRRGFWYTVSEGITPDKVLDRIWIRASDLYEGQREDTRRIADCGDAKKLSIFDSIGD